MVDHSIIDSTRSGRGEQPEAGTAKVSAARVGPPARGRGPASLPATQRRVRTPELALGLLLAAGCGLGAVLWTASASSTTPALVLARDVQRGQVLELADFASADARTVGMRLIAYSERNDYVGRVAAIDLEAASAITDSVALRLAPVAEGEALVGVRVEAGEFPTGLRAGSTVRLVGVSDPTTIARLAAVNIVVESITPVDGAVDQIVVTVRLPIDLVDAVTVHRDLQIAEVAA